MGCLRAQYVGQGFGPIEEEGPFWEDVVCRRAGRKGRERVVSGASQGCNVDLDMLVRTWDVWFGI